MNPDQINESLGMMNLSNKVMRILTRDDTDHETEYVTREEAESTIRDILRRQHCAPAPGSGFPARSWLTVGKYSLILLGGGKIQVSNGEGESMECHISKLEPYIKRFFNDKF